MMEYWFLKDTINLLVFFVKMNFAIYPPVQFPITHYSNIPSFQHSNWGEAPKFFMALLGSTARAGEFSRAS